MQNNIWYIAVKKCGPGTKDDFDWEKYKNWSKLHHLTEVVSLDSILCPPVIERDNDNDWDHLVKEDYMIDFYTNLDYLKKKLNDKEGYSLLAVVREPDHSDRQPRLHGFELLGFELVDREMSISALTNCGGFDETFMPNELNQYGLIDNRDKAFDVRTRLIQNNPVERHADCWVFEIWRAKN